MNNKFVKVPNDWFDIKDNITIVSQIGVKGFGLWFYLKKRFIELNSNKIELRLGELHRDVKNFAGLSKIANLKKELLHLEELELLEFENLNELTKAKDNIIIHNIQIENYFQMINIDIYNDKAIKIGFDGLLVYCFLHKTHQLNFGSKHSLGLTSYSTEFIGRVTGIGRNRVGKIINKLISSKNLIKSFESKCIFYNDKYSWTPRAYIVFPKSDPENKYYVKIKSK